MTIISAVYVPEGIAISADSRLTQNIEYIDSDTRESFVVSDAEEKIILIRENSVAIAYSSDYMIDGFFMPDFLRSFDKHYINKYDPIPVIAYKLNEFLIKHSVQGIFFICGYDDNMPYVYEVLKNSIELRNHENGEILYNARWAGNFSPIDNLLKDSPIDYRGLSLNNALNLADFIADTAIKYWNFIPQYSNVGGPIDLLAITNESTKFIKRKPHLYRV